MSLRSGTSLIPFTHLGCHRASDLSFLCQIPTGHLFCTCSCFKGTLSIPLTLCFPHCIHKSVLYVWVSIHIRSDQISRSVMSDSATPCIAACQASLSITNSRSSLRLTSIKSVMPSSHLILCCPLLLVPPIPPSFRVFSNESTLCMRWPKYWSFSFSIIPSK